MSAAASGSEQFDQSHPHYHLSGEFFVPGDHENMPRSLAQLAVEATMANGTIWVRDTQITISAEDQELSRVTLSRGDQRMTIDIHEDASIVETPAYRDLLALQTDRQRDFARYDIAFHVQAFFKE
jgi:hypothetical protein